MNNIEKFEDFLDKMQGLLDNAKKQGHIIVRVEDLERTFPELAESEDERIRKELIDFVRSRLAGFPQCDRYIAWLEKQDEQKPAWSEEDEEAINLACSILYSNFNENENFDKNQMCVGEIIDKLKSLKERYTWRPSDEQLKELNAINVTGCVSDAGQAQELINLYNDLKNLREKKL